MAALTAEELRLRSAIALERLAGSQEKTEERLERIEGILTGALGENGPVARQARYLDAQEQARAAGSAGLIAAFGHPAVKYLGTAIGAAALSWLASRGIFPETPPAQAGQEEVRDAGP